MAFPSGSTGSSPTGVRVPDTSRRSAAASLVARAVVHGALYIAIALGLAVIQLLGGLARGAELGRFITVAGALTGVVLLGLLFLSCVAVILDYERAYSENIPRGFVRALLRVGQVLGIGWFGLGMRAPRPGERVRLVRDYEVVEGVTLFCDGDQEEEHWIHESPGNAAQGSEPEARVRRTIPAGTVATVLEYRRKTRIVPGLPLSPLNRRVDLRLVVVRLDAPPGRVVFRGGDAQSLF